MDLRFQGPRNPVFSRISYFSTTIIVIGAATLVSYSKVRRRIETRTSILPRIRGLSMLLALAVPAFAAEHIQLPTGDLRAAVLTDLKPHSSSSKTYNEFWTYHFYLDGNIQVILNFSRANLGSFKDPVCGADLTIMGFKGRNFTVAREYDKKNFTFSEADQELRVHEKISFSGKLPDAHRVHFATSKKEVSYLLDLDFSDILPGKVWGDGMFKFGGGDAVGIFIHIPSASVKGKLAINNDTLNVAGRAYMDHTFQTDLAPHLVGSGFRFVTQEGPLEIGYVLNPLGKFDRQPVGYGLRLVNGNLVLRKPTALKALSSGKAMGMKIATSLEITYLDGGKSVMNRSGDRLQQSVLHEFSGFTKSLVKSFMGGEIFTFRGLGNLNGTQAMAYNWFAVE